MTIELLRLNEVVGVRSTVSETGQLTSLGITCAFCHSIVDNSFGPGIGKRLDGWANLTLNVGAIVALSPALPDALKAEFRPGPGKYDPRHHAFDGTNLVILSSPSLPIVLPSIYGLKGVVFETFTADGPISYWNAYVGIGQMGGHGNLTQTPDLVTPKLPALLDYQLSLHAPKSPKGSSIDKRRTVASVCLTGRLAPRRATKRRISRTCLAAPKAPCHSCTIRPKSGWIRRMPPKPPPANTERRRCGERNRSCARRRTASGPRGRQRGCGRPCGPGLP